jgi:OPA family glycerol-3-phosphate transporter-like MFS transporter
MSYLAGDAFARWFLGQAIVSGASWRGVFFIAAATLGAIAIANLFMVRGKPSEVGLEEPDANPRSLYDEEPDEALPRLPMRRLLAPALTSFTFWLICTMNFGLTLVRETFNTWNPTYLNEMTGLDAGRAAIGSLLFPAVGAISALLAGLVTDRLSGRHGRVIVPCLIGLVVILVMLGLVDVDGRPTTALVLICGASFFLIAPYSFYSGVMALDLGGKRGAATIAGLSDSAGYAGGMVSGVGVGALAEHYSWAVAFLALAGVVFLTLCVAVVYWLRQERFEDERAAREGADVA